MVCTPLERRQPKASPDPPCGSWQGGWRRQLLCDCLLKGSQQIAQHKHTLGHRWRRSLDAQVGAGQPPTGAHVGAKVEPQQGSSTTQEDLSGKKTNPRDARCTRHQMWRCLKSGQGSNQAQIASLCQKRLCRGSSAPTCRRHAGVCRGAGGNRCTHVQHTLVGKQVPAQEL
jgi:hypothetical protein